jgi:hypothetical protein
MSPVQAEIIAALIEIATDGNWPATRNGLLDRGYTPDECVEAIEELCNIAGISPILGQEDF